MSPRLSIDAQQVWDLGYEILSLATSNPCTDVWELRHRTTYELFAWKQLKQESELDERARSEIRNEAAVYRLVKSSFLPKVISAHVDEAPRYLLTEWFSGDTLEQAIQEFAPLSIGLSLWITRQCAQGIQDLHQAGLTHGDLQPANVLIRENGTICLTELGQSRRILPTKNLDTLRRGRHGDGPLEDCEKVIRQHQPPQGTAKDIYGLGVILYRTLTGRFPFERLTAAEVLQGESDPPASVLRRLRPEVSVSIGELAGELLSPPTQQGSSSLSVIVDRLMGLELEQFLRNP